MSLSLEDLSTSLSTSKTLKVGLTDVNDEVPKFLLESYTVSVVEEKAPSPNDPPLGYINATDADSTERFKTVPFLCSLLDCRTASLWRLE